MLSDHYWRLKYTPDDGDLVRIFYLPALEDAESYDRLTGYFKAGALTLAARGIEGLVRNAGRMRLLVGCTLDPPEIEAIERGENLRDAVEQHLGAIPLEPADQESTDALELLAWMVAGGHLEVKVAVPCDANRRPIFAEGIFHEKSGVIEDRVGDRIAWTGSLNETAAGWRQNWESISVFKSWGEGSEPERVTREQTNFDRLWADESPHVVVLDAPEAARRDLLRFMPESDKPARLKRGELAATPDEPPAPVTGPPAPPPKAEPDLRSRVWSFIQQAPSLPGGGRRVGEATAAVTPWPHQVRAFERLYAEWPPRLLIADEVGLGKTIEAGLLWTELRTRYDFRRLLVLCPAVLREKWQRELKNRFGVDAEILDARGTLKRLRQAANEETPSFAVIASLQGLRPKKRWRESTDGAAASELARFLLDREQADPLIDMCVVDEAHHLRNRETTTSQLARLARTVSDYIVLLTATPIHLRSNDLHELLRLVDEGMFDRGQSFTELLEANAPLVRARELVVGGAPSGATSLPEHLELELRNADRNPLLQDNRQLKRLLDEKIWTEDFSNPANVARVAERLDRLNLLGHTVTRTRRREVQEHRPERDVKAVPVEATPAEMEFYSNVTRLVRDYCMASDVSAAFLEVTPQRQMSSSMPAALRLWQQGTGGGYEALDDWTDEEGPLKSELIAQARQLGDLDALWTRDSKYEHLAALLSDWFNKEPDSKVIVFSSYLATLDYLEERLKQRGIPCMVLQGSTSDKDHAVEQFRQSPSAQVLLSSEVGSEGIDLQFAKVVINYDLPWNPMRVEQRIGRVDRLGQKASQIHVRNLFYKDTIDARIHERLMDRLGIFEGALGGLEPILGEVVRNLRKQLFTTHLTPEQENQRIEQARFALENRRRAEEELEQEAAHLTAYGDYVLRQIGAARDLHRSISAPDLVKYVTDYLRMHYRGCLFRQIPGHDLVFDIDLSNEARFDLANFIRQEKLDGDSCLTRSSLREVRCRFENSTVPRIRRGEEAINQFHPLVRFVSSRLEVSEERRRPAVAVRLRASRLLGEVGPGIYGFSVQRWSVRGLRHAEKLSYAAIPVAPAGDPLRSGDAELLRLFQRMGGFRRHGD